jgi:hypothetical protein
MTASTPSAPKAGAHFTSFRSAAEEATTKNEQEAGDNEGGHMSSRAGRVVHTAGSPLAYKVILTHGDGEESERAFATMREAEVFIRASTPVPVDRRTLYDRDAPGT